MVKTDSPRRYAATRYDTAGKRTVWLSLQPDGLRIDDGAQVKTWPLAQVYAGQMGQGEAECIGISTEPDLRLFVSPGFLTAVKAAIRGEPYRLPRTWHIPVGPAVLFGFLAACGAIWVFFD